MQLFGGGSRCGESRICGSAGVVAQQQQPNIHCQQLKRGPQPIKLAWWQRAPRPAGAPKRLQWCLRCENGEERDEFHPGENLQRHPTRKPREERGTASAATDLLQGRSQTERMGSAGHPPGQSVQGLRLDCPSPASPRRALRTPPSRSHPRPGCAQSTFEVFIIFCVLYTAIVEPLKVTYVLNVCMPPPPVPPGSAPVPCLPSPTRVPPLPWLADHANGRRLSRLDLRL